jgi:hypothetical protein
MRALIASPLNDDIVYLIMTFCPTFASLLDMMLVSKAFYRVYQTHPKVETAFRSVSSRATTALN